MLLRSADGPPRTMENGQPNTTAHAQPEPEPEPEPRPEELRSFPDNGQLEHAEEGRGEGDDSLLLLPGTANVAFTGDTTTQPPACRDRPSSSIDQRDGRKEDSYPTATRPQTAPESVGREPSQRAKARRRQASARPNSRRGRISRDRAKPGSRGGSLERESLVDGSGVESNGVSWQFLQRFTNGKLSSEMKEEATRRALRRIEKQVTQTKIDLQAVWKKRRKQTAVGVAAERPEMLRAVTRGAVHYQTAGTTAIGLRLGKQQEQKTAGQWQGDLGTGYTRSALADMCLPFTLCDDILRRVDVLDKEEDGYTDLEEQMGGWSAEDFPRWRSDRGTMLGYHLQSQRWVLTTQYTSLWSETTVFSSNGMLHLGERVWRQQGTNVVVDLQLLSGMEEEKQYVSELSGLYKHQLQQLIGTDAPRKGEDNLMTDAAEPGALPVVPRPLAARKRESVEASSAHTTKGLQNQDVEMQRDHEGPTRGHSEHRGHSNPKESDEYSDNDDGADRNLLALDRLRQAVATVQTDHQAHNREHSSSGPKFASVVYAEMAENPYVPRQEKEEMLLRRLHFLSLDLTARCERAFVTARDIKDLVIVPDTQEQGCAFVELTSVKNSLDPVSKTSYVRLSNYVVAFSWEQDWEHLVSALGRHTKIVISAGLPVPYYFIDLLGHNQHATAMHMWECRKGFTECTACQSFTSRRVGTPIGITDLAQADSTITRKDWLLAPDLLARQLEDVARVTAHTKCTLILLEPWHDPRPFRRAWPLYEAWCTLVTPGGELDAVIGDTQDDQIHAHFLHLFRALATMAESTDVKLAEAEFDEDQERILGAIESSSKTIAVKAGSSRETNINGCRRKLRKQNLRDLTKRLQITRKRWLINTARELLDEEHELELQALSGPCRLFCRICSSKRKNENAAVVARHRVLCCLPPGVVVRSCGNSLLVVAAALLWFAVVHCVLFYAEVLQLPLSSAQRQAGISTNNGVDGDDDGWRRRLSTQAAVSGVVCVVIGSIFIWTAEHTELLARPDGLRQQWTRSAMVHVPIQHVSNCARTRGCGQINWLRHSPRAVGVFVCIFSATVACSIHLSLRTANDASGLGSTTTATGTASSHHHHFELLLICWLCLLLGLLTEHTAAAGRAAEYGRAELAALMGSMQLELHETENASETFRIARKRLMGAFGTCGPAAGASGTARPRQSRVNVDSGGPCELSDYNWAQLWAAGWPSWSKEEAFSLANDRAHRLLASHTTPGSGRLQPGKTSRCFGALRTGVTLTAAGLSCGMTSWRRRLVQRPAAVVATSTCACAKLVPVIGFCATAAIATLYLELGVFTWRAVN